MKSLFTFNPHIFKFRISEDSLCIQFFLFDRQVDTFHPVSQPGTHIPTYRFKQPQLNHLAINHLQTTYSHLLLKTNNTAQHGPLPTPTLLHNPHRPPTPHNPNLNPQPNILHLHPAYHPTLQPHRRLPPPGHHPSPKHRRRSLPLPPHLPRRLQIPRRHRPGQRKCHFQNLRPPPHSKPNPEPNPKYHVRNHHRHLPRTIGKRIRSNGRASTIPSPEFKYSTSTCQRSWEWKWKCAG